MRTYTMSPSTRVLLILALASGLAVPRAHAQRLQATGDWTAVERALGRPGTAQPGGVMKFGFPRGDLAVTTAGVEVKPALALGSWVAFQDITGGRAMAVGDLVLRETEVTPVMDRLERGGVEITAVHEHLLGEQPRLLYMHIHGTGAPVALASTIRAALERTATPLGTSGGTAAGPLDLDTAAIARTLGAAGRASGGVYQVAVPRRERITDHGVPLTPAMGVATSINFQPTGGGHAAVTGDFVLTSAEVNPVIRVLRAGGVAVTALHSHMLDESPRLFFMHYWANDDAAALARTLRAALDRTNSAIR